MIFYYYDIIQVIINVMQYIIMSTWCRANRSLRSPDFRRARARSIRIALYDRRKIVYNCYIRWINQHLGILFNISVWRGGRTCTLYEIEYYAVYTYAVIGDTESETFFSLSLSFPVALAATATRPSRRFLLSPA